LNVRQGEYFENRIPSGKGHWNSTGVSPGRCGKRSDHEAEASKLVVDKMRLRIDMSHGSWGESHG
jgi:hypothetical protein